MLVHKCTLVLKSVHVCIMYVHTCMHCLCIYTVHVHVHVSVHVVVDVSVHRGTMHIVYTCTFTCITAYNAVLLRYKMYTCVMCLSCICIH